MVVVELFSIIGLTSIVEAIGLYFVRAKGWLTLIGGILAYGLGVAPCLRYATKYEGIGMVNLLWNVVSTILGFAIGIYLYGEKVHGIKLIGILVALLGLGIIGLSPDYNDK